MFERIRQWWRRDAADSSDMAMPPEARNHDGQARHIGVEIEFSGLSIESIAGTLRDTLGGEIDPVSAYEYTLKNSTIGDVGIELDFSYLKRLGRESGADDGPLDKLSEDLLAAVARQVVPFEVVSPPIPMHRLDEFNAAIKALQAAGAKGTRHAPLYAFGLHLNPELPALDADTIRRYMQAFACLFEWLRQEENVDLSRRVTPYIEPWPKEYLAKLCNPDYAPDLETLLDDYLVDNPTRNRALDMTPLIAHLDRELLERHIEDDRINARPTLHYRLPNCEIDDPDWSLAKTWQRWLVLEQLACDPARLERVCAAYCEYLERPVDRLMRQWGEDVRQWIE